MPESDESSIERLKRTLYSRNENLVPKEKRTPVPPREFDVPTNWGDNPEFGLPPEALIKRKNSFFNKYFLISIGFFVVSMLVAAYIFFGGINMISSNNLTVDVIAPTSVSSGEELSVGLSIVNGNRTDLENVTLFITYPEGAESSSPDSGPISHDQIDLGTIAKGATAEHSIRTTLFGEKDVIKSFIFKVEYKVKGSNATFSKQKQYDVIIGSSPVLLEVKYPKEVNSGQDISFTIEVTSNSPVPIKSTLLKVEYPYGFTYKSSSLKPVSNNSVWNMGDLKNGDKKTLNIVGTLAGQNLEERSFRILAGTRLGSAYDIDTTLASTLITLGLRKSFFDLDVSTFTKEVAQVGQTIPTSIRWQNTLPDKIVDAKIEVKLSGNALDRSKVTVSSGGYYKSVEDTIIWDKNSVGSLVEISPGSSSDVGFSVASLPNLVQPKLIKNAHIDLSVNMTGERSGREGGSVASTKETVIKIVSAIGITSKTLRDTGPFTNSGPIPPKADKESTYTVNWVLTNTTNDLKETLVKATLPPGVSWKGEFSPSSEKVTYDPDTRTVTWDVGNVSAGTGFVYAPQQVYFKLSLIPSISQIGISPALISQTNVYAIDTYIEKQIEANTSPATTLYSDPSYVAGREIVVK